MIYEPPADRAPRAVSLCRRCITIGHDTTRCTAHSSAPLQHRGMAAMTGNFGSLPSSLKDKQRHAILRLLNFNSDTTGERTTTPTHESAVHREREFLLRCCTTRDGCTGDNPVTPWHNSMAAHTARFDPQGMPMFTVAQVCKCIVKLANIPGYCC